MLSPGLIQIFINSWRLPETDARKMITVPRSGQLLILRWYFWNHSSFVHRRVEYMFLSSLEHCDSHTDGIKRSRWDESPRGLGTLTHLLVLSFWKKSKELNSPVPPLHTQRAEVQANTLTQDATGNLWWGWEQNPDFLNPLQCLNLKSTLSH